MVQTHFRYQRVGRKNCEPSIVMETMSPEEKKKQKLKFMIVKSRQLWGHIPHFFTPVQKKMILALVASSRGGGVLMGLVAKLSNV